MKNNLYALLLCYAERYINVSDEQAEFDTTFNREKMVAAFNAILEYLEMGLHND